MTSSRALRASVAAAVVVGAVATAATLAAGAPPASVDWPHYGNDLANTRYQPLDQITPTNASQLRPAWVFHTGVRDPEASLEVSPVVVAGRMYVTTGHDDVFALDASTGKEIWAYHPERSMPSLDRIKVCCGFDNRGVAVAGGLVYLARLDGVLVALDAATGRPRWQARVASWRAGYSLTMAPQAAAGLVLVGVSGGEFLTRGAVAAFDAATGQPVWRFGTTIPGSSWHGTSWRTGGAPVWGNPSVDPALGLAYVTTGNAAPDFNGSRRAGENRDASSIVALDLRTGRPRWAFQEVHHDLWDYDGPQPPMLFSVTRNGRTVPALGHCNKDGNYFVLDRRTGKPVWPVAERRVPAGPAWQHAWPTQPMSSIQPLTPLGVSHTPHGDTSAPEFTPPGRTPLLIQPGAQAGCEWEPAAYSPRTRDVYYGARYQPTIYAAAPTSWKPNSEKEVLGSREVTPVPGVRYYGLFGATSTTTGKVVWKVRVPQLAASGAVVAGDLVFFGQQNGVFDAFDAATGKVAWSFAGTTIRGAGGATAAPIAYEAAGREFVADAFGGNADDRSSRKQRSPLGDAIVAFSLPTAP